MCWRRPRSRASRATLQLMDALPACGYDDEDVTVRPCARCSVRSYSWGIGRYAEAFRSPSRCPARSHLRTTRTRSPAVVYMRPRSRRLAPRLCARALLCPDSSPWLRRSVSPPCAARQRVRVASGVLSRCALVLTCVLTCATAALTPFLGAQPTYDDDDDDEPPPPPPIFSAPTGAPVSSLSKYCGSCSALRKRSRLCRTMLSARERAGGGGS